MRFSRASRLQIEHDRLEAQQPSPWLTYFELFYLRKYSAIGPGLRYVKKYKIRTIRKRIGPVSYSYRKTRRLIGYRAKYDHGSPLTQFLKEPLERVLGEMASRSDVKPEEIRHLRIHLVQRIKQKHRNQLKQARPPLRRQRKRKR